MLRLQNVGLKKNVVWEGFKKKNVKLGLLAEPPLTPPPPPNLGPVIR